MTRLLGKAISGGLHKGIARVIDSTQLVVDHQTISSSDVDSEWQRFLSAIEHIIKDTKGLLDDLSLAVSDQEILNSHIMIMEDPEFHKAIENSLSKDLVCLESALNKHFSYMVEYFKSMEDEYFRQRADDYADINERLLTHLTGKSNSDLSNITASEIPVLNEVIPSQIISLFNNKVSCICTEHGSETSHSSILARSMGITLVTELKNIKSKIATGDLLLVDGNEGVVIVEPDADTLKVYEIELQEEALEQAKLKEIINLETQTLDGTKISLSVNMELPEELDRIEALNSDGIGLFRTEFLYLETDMLPTEQAQFEVYKKVLERMKDKPVIIRTMDLGGDKFASDETWDEDNPYLGCRGIRLSLLKPEMFKTQIRALLRAGLYGKLWVMFPMINDIEDYNSAMSIVKECVTELESDNIEFSNSNKFGTMIEVPSAALTSSELAEVCDFFSIGSNDLTQYTVAVDRNNSTIANLYKPNHPAVLKLMKMTLNSAKEWGIPVGLCGEMASNPEYIETLLKLGFRSLSTGPAKFAKIKETIRNINL